MAQQALRLRSMSPQLRQVSRTSPAASKTSNITNMTKELLDVLRYVPSTVYNKIQGSLSMSSGLSGTGSGTAGNTVPPAEPEANPHPVSPELENVTSKHKKKVMATSVPGPPSDDPNYKPEEGMGAKVTDLPTDPEETVLGMTKEDMASNWPNIEARTRYLVSALQKSFGVDTPRNLMHHIDSLFLHIYQHHGTRNTAVSNGLVKILNKILKAHSEEVYLVNRTRELLAILGCNPPIKGRGIRVLSIDGGGVR